ncbi:hypothetical protein BJ165DRAFT_1597673 [Panaeolus papilionaceus]|nr:hypothetical protein BJ165DRAFT_1597673 [Panaeolus papilionaceus]
MDPTPPALPPSRKRKRTQAHAASPAPSDATDTNKASTDLLASRADLSSRPVLTISRGPVFVAAPEGSPWNKTELVAMNRVGYRYIPAGINPPGCAAPCRTIESNPTSFRISWEDRSPYLRVTKDGLCLAGAKGFRSARCNAPIREGKWYLEVRILQGGSNHNPSTIVVDEANGLPPPPPPLDDGQRREGPYVRIGFGRREAPLNGPAGLDGYSYGYRDKTGDKVTLSRPRPYGREFSTGDVVGMYISLPPKRQPNPRDPHDPAHLHRERIPIDFKGQEVFELLEYPQSKEMTSLMDYSAGKGADTGSIASGAGVKKAGVGVKPEMSGGGAIIPSGAAMGNSAPSGMSTPNPKARTQPGKAVPSAPPLRTLPILPGSRIAFFVNGECQGTAFRDIYDYLPLRQTETQRKAKEKKRTREGVKEHRENPFDDGTLGYYPFISLFNEASIKINPGPDFEYPPPDDIDALLDEIDKKKLAGPIDESKKENDIPPSAPSPAPMDVDPPATSNIPLKPEQDDASISIILHASDTTTSTRTWRPACELYGIFMASERALDQEEEKIARIELDKQDAIFKVEEEKRAQRGKKKQAADARKKAKTAAAVAAKGKPPTPSPTPGPADSSTSLHTKLDEKTHSLSSSSALSSMGGGVVLMNVYGASNSPNATSRSASPLGYHVTNASGPSPSPLRQSTAYQAYREDEEGASEADPEDKPFLVAGSGISAGGEKTLPSRPALPHQVSSSNASSYGPSRTETPPPPYAFDAAASNTSGTGQGAFPAPLNRPGSKGANPYVTAYKQPSTSSTPFDRGTSDTTSEHATPAHDDTNIIKSRAQQRHAAHEYQYHQRSPNPNTALNTPLNTNQHPSPAPTHASEVYLDGVQSGYTSENPDGADGEAYYQDHEQEQEQEQSEPETDILLQAPSQRADDDGSESEHEHDVPRDDEGADTDAQSNMGEGEGDAEDPDIEPDPEGNPEAGDYEMTSEME